MIMFADFYKDMNKNISTNREFEKVKFAPKFLHTLRKILLGVNGAKQR